MNKALRILAVLLVLMIVVGLTAVLAGCSKVESLGILGGNSQVIKNYVYSPGVGWQAATQPATTESVTAAPVTITTTAHQTDGGTAFLGKNPSESVKPEPTTQPSQ